MMISGLPPFDGQTNKEILDKIKRKDYDIKSTHLLR